MATDLKKVTLKQWLRKLYRKNIKIFPIVVQQKKAETHQPSDAIFNLCCLCKERCRILCTAYFSIQRLTSGLGRKLRLLKSQSNFLPLSKTRQCVLCHVASQGHARSGICKGRRFLASSASGSCQRSSASTSIHHEAVFSLCPHGVLCLYSPVSSSPPPTRTVTPLG